MITKKNILLSIFLSPLFLQASEVANPTEQMPTAPQSTCEQNPVCAELIEKIKNAVQHVHLLYTTEMFKPHDESWHSPVESLKNDLLETAARQNNQCVSSVLEVLVKELDANPNGNGNALFSAILLGNVKNFEKLIELGARLDQKNYEGLTIAECIEKYAENWIDFSNGLAEQDEYQKRLKKQFFTVISNNTNHDKN